MTIFVFLFLGDPYCVKGLCHIFSLNLILSTGLCMSYFSGANVSMKKNKQPSQVLTNSRVSVCMQDYISVFFKSLLFFTTYPKQTMSKMKKTTLYPSVLI